MSFCYGQDDAAMGQQVALLSHLLGTSTPFGGPLPSPALAQPTASAMVSLSGLHSAASCPAFPAASAAGPYGAEYAPHGGLDSGLKRAQSLVAQLASMQLGCSPDAPRQLHRQHSVGSYLLAPQQQQQQQHQHQPSIGWGGESIKHQQQVLHDSPGRGRGRTGRLSRRPSGRTPRGGGPGSARGVRLAEPPPVDDLIACIRHLRPCDDLGEAAASLLRLFDGRSVATAIKELAKSGLADRSAQLFDWLAGLPAGHELAHLADVYSYTAAISNCVPRQELDRAMRLMAAMGDRGVERSVHTYTSVMNVCIKVHLSVLLTSTFFIVSNSGQLCCRDPIAIASPPPSHHRPNSAAACSWRSRCTIICAPRAWRPTW